MESVFTECTASYIPLLNFNQESQDFSTLNENNKSASDQSQCKTITDATCTKFELTSTNANPRSNNIAIKPSNGSRCSVDNDCSYLKQDDLKTIKTDVLLDEFSQKISENTSLLQNKCEELNKQKKATDICENELAATIENLNTSFNNDLAASFSSDPENIISNSRRVSIQRSSTEDIMNGNPQGWETVRKKLPNIAALQKGVLCSRKSSKRFFVEQDSFLEKFSTREYKQEHKNLSYQRRSSKPNVFLGLPKPQSFNSIDKAEKLSFSMSRESAVSLMPITEDNSEEADGEEEKFSFFLCCNYFGFDFNFKSVIEPHCNIMYYWQYLLLMAIHYNAWIVITRISFFEAQRKFSHTWFALDYIGDLIYVTDILISMRISFLENGMYVTELKRVALRYLVSSNFALDAVSLLPLDLLYFKFGSNPILRLPRLIKFHKVFQARKMIESLTSIPNIIRAVFLLHLMFLLIHWNGCLYFMISKAEGFGSNSWVYPKLTGRRAELINQYIHCFYWATLSLTTIGEGRGGPITLAENIYMIVCYITGIFIFATIVGQAGSVIQNMNASRMDFEKQRDKTMQYMKAHNVPKDLQRRVRLWYDYSYSRGRFQGGNDINEMTLLPNKMKTELALHVHLETLRKVSFLQKVQPDFLHDLVLKMKLHIFTPGDYICRKGEIAREMYVISDGILEVVSETGTVLKVLYPGNFFGEIGILSLSGGQNRRTADVRCCGYVELFVLYKDDVLAAIRDYPETQKILSRYGRKRLNRGNPGANGSEEDSNSESEDEKREPLDIVKEDTNDTKPEEELSNDNNVSTLNELIDKNNLSSPVLRGIDVDPIHKVTRKSVDDGSQFSSAHSSPKKHPVSRVKSNDSTVINMPSLDSPLHSSKSSIHTAIMSVVNPFLCPTPPKKPKETKETPTALRRKAFAETRSSSSPLMRKEKLPQPSMPKKLQEDITTEVIHVQETHHTEKLEEKIFFRKSLNEAHAEAIQTLESSFYKKIQKEQMRLREKIDELEGIIDAKNEEINLLKDAFNQQEILEEVKEAKDVKIEEQSILQPTSKLDGAEGPSSHS